MFALSHSCAARRRTMPYNDMRTNYLAIISQVILVFSYCATILLKVRSFKISLTCMTSSPA
jgi:hypothetical protein